VGRLLARIAPLLLVLPGCELNGGPTNAGPTPGAAVPPAEPPAAKGELLFSEGFDDPRLPERRWYDGDRFRVSRPEARTGAGCIEYHWPAGATNPDSSSGIRRLFEPGETLYLRFYLKLSKGWGWTGRDYHPHLITFMTTENGQYHGPAASHLTLYVEPQEGKLRLAAREQDLLAR